MSVKVRESSETDKCVQVTREEDNMISRKRL